MVVHREVGHCLTVKPATECSLRKSQKLEGLKRKHMKCMSWNKLALMYYCNFCKGARLCLWNWAVNRLIAHLQNDTNKYIVAVE